MGKYSNGFATASGMGIIGEYGLEPVGQMTD
jgi:hypothetical protein